MFTYLAQYLQNFAFIFLSMAVFFAPFILWFWLGNRQEIGRARPHFNYFMEQYFRSKQADYLVFFWAALEALLWFIIPEFLLVLVVFMKVHRKVRLVTYDIAGTVVGTIVGLAWSLPRSVLLHVPYVYPHMIERVDTWYAHYGIWGLWLQPLSGVPYKLFVSGAHHHGFFIVWFLIIAVAARISRYVLAYQLTIWIYPLVHTFVRKHYAWLFLFATAVFTGLLMHVVQLYR